MRKCYVLVVIDEDDVIHKHRKYRTLKLALAHGRRNIKAGNLCWIEAGQWSN